MTKINEIQNKILELNGGEFQKMMDVYFSKTINGEVYSIGSVIGNNNTKTGTPDTLIRTSESEYIFIEYTVQKSGLFKKFEDDLEKCLDESKTNIPLNEIEKIICCCTGRLSTEEISKLNAKVSDYNIRLELLTIDAISFKIFDFPSIASDFLNITLDTEQILDIDDFVKVYNRGRLATTLDTNLYARDSEIELVMESLNRNQITVLSGKPGIGKTRLALECVRKFKETNLEYGIKCLRNNGQNLYTDLKFHFSAHGKYLLFIDDVNQLTQLNLILDYLGLEKEGIELKLIVSVREYAERKILDKVSKLNSHLIKIDVLKDKAIETLCKEEYDIKNHQYIERICKISKGNARLAIMACETAIRENTLESIGNVTDLVEEYFKGIKTDFNDELENNELLKVAAIYSFLNVVNLKDENNLVLMAQIANLEKTDFLRMTEKLHSMEILDIYEGEVAKASDQILSTYIYYLVIFDKKLLHYSELIETYFPKLKNRIIENLNGVFSYFYQKENYELIKEEINNVYVDLKEKSDDKLEDFLHTFWFALELETLAYLQEKIEQLPKMEDYQVNYDTSKQTPRWSEILSTLSNFSQTKYYKEALELIIKYLQKKPTEFSSVYSVLTQAFGFKQISERQNFIIQKELMNLVIVHYEQEKSLILQMLLIKLSGYYLKFTHHITEMSDNKTLKFYDFTLSYTQSILEIREIAWITLNNIYSQNEKEVSKVLFEFGTQGIAEKDKDILSRDINFISDIIENLTTEITLRESIVFNKINDFLLKQGLELESSLIKKINSETYMLYKVMAKETFGLDYTQKEHEKKQYLINIAKDLTLIEYNDIFEILDVVTDYEVFQTKIYPVFNSFSVLLENCKEDMAVEILRVYISKNYHVNLYPISILEKLRKTVKDHDIVSLLNENEFYGKNYWRYCFLKVVSYDKANLENLNNVYDYFCEEKEDINEPIIDLEFLKNYLSIEEDIFIKVTKIILKFRDTTVKSNLRNLFNPYAEINKELFFLFRNDLNTLKSAYLRLVNIDSNIDSELLIFKRFIDLDLDIVEGFLEQSIRNTKITLSDLNLSFVWKLKEWQTILDRIMDFLNTNSSSNFYDRALILENLISSVKEDKIIERQDSWLKENISLWCYDEDKIIMLFYGIVNLNKERKSKHLISLLENNDSFDLFSKVPLFSLTYSWSDSEVPILVEKLEFLKLVDDSIIGIKFLKHKRWIQENIEYYKERIKKVKILEYMEDY